MSIAKPVHCETCGQVITEATALEQERKRQQVKAEENAKEKAMEKAFDAAIAKVKEAIKKVNLEHKGILQLSIDEYYESNDPKDPIEGLRLNVRVAGLSGDHLDEMNGMKEIKAFFKKLGSPLQ